MLLTNLFLINELRALGRYDGWLLGTQRPTRIVCIAARMMYSPPRRRRVVELNALGQRVFITV